jgi:hypothetical protein
MAHAQSVDHEIDLWKPNVGVGGADEAQQGADANVGLWFGRLGVCLSSWL